jgi:hypothetical protein
MSRKTLWEIFSRTHLVTLSAATSSWQSWRAGTNSTVMIQKPAKRGFGRRHAHHDTPIQLAHKGSEGGDGFLLWNNYLRSIFSGG